MKAMPSSLFLLCTILCVHDSQSVRSFGSLEEFMQFYFATSNNQNDETTKTTTAGPITTEGHDAEEQQFSIGTTGWLTTFLSDPELDEEDSVDTAAMNADVQSQPDPHYDVHIQAESHSDMQSQPESSSLLIRCCELGRMASNEQLNCHQFGNVNIHSTRRDRNRPGSNYRFSGVNPISLSNRHIREFDTCTSSQADDLKHEFMRCCKENSILSLPNSRQVVVVNLPHIKPHVGHHNTRYQPGMIKRWPY